MFVIFGKWVEGHNLSHGGAVVSGKLVFIKGAYRMNGFSLGVRAAKERMPAQKQDRKVLDVSVS